MDGLSLLHHLASNSVTPSSASGRVVETCGATMTEAERKRDSPSKQGRYSCLRRGFVSGRESRYDGQRKQRKGGTTGVLWCVRGVRPSRPIGASRAARRAAGKGGSERNGTQAGPNPYTRATKGQEERDPKQPNQSAAPRAEGSREG
ncbi:hypothetical protein B0H13DRAFT_1865087 [Mycena leptocephala]|nr:hypothetical protein B0H13DRAFT_1865087 [Mycena leptocephala]